MSIELSSSPAGESATPRDIPRERLPPPAGESATPRRAPRPFPRRQRRSNARESRREDLDEISRLKRRISDQRKASEQLDAARRRTQLELENEREQDKIFGPDAANAAKQRNQKRRDDAARGRNFQRPVSFYK